MTAICRGISSLILGAAIATALTAGPPPVDIGPPAAEYHTTIVGPEERP